MLEVNSLKQFTAEMQGKISGINKSIVLLDDSELTNILKELKLTENCILIAIMPQYPVKGNDDAIKWVNQLQFMILKKSADRDFKNHDEYLDMFQQTQLLMKEFVNILLMEKTGDNGDLCGLLNELVEQSILVYPVWRKAQCNGWALEIDLLSNI